MCAKTASMTVSPAPLTPSEAIRAVERLAAPSSLTSSKTTPCQARTSSSVAASSSGEARSSSGAPSSSAPPGTRSRQARRRPLGRPLGGGPDDRLDPVLDRDAQLGIGRGRAR